MASESALSKKLSSLSACSEATDWAKGKTLAVAWRTCPRGDWMLWLAGRSGVRRQDLVLAACACARLALVHVKTGETRPLKAIETAEAWARGEAGVTLEQVRAAASAAAYAASAYAASAYAASASAASYAASYAASASAAAYAAYAAYAASASAAAAYAAARTKTLRACASLVRKQIPYKTIATAMKGT